VSSHKTVRRNTVPELRARKGGQPIVCLTAYTTPMAQLLDDHVDLLLVGDSLGMVVYGFSSTLPVTLDMMIAHGAAVVRGSRRACVVVDLPFATYQSSPAQAFDSSARVLQDTGAQAVKLEGGREMAPSIAFLVERGIPVMAHIGLTPQSINALGGYGSRGRDQVVAQRLREDAHAVSQAGAFSVVIENVVEPLAREITEQLPVPTIGIGASPACDGQVLVVDDMLGMFTAFKPRFVKRYGQMAEVIDAAVARYALEVRDRVFPSTEHCTHPATPTHEPSETVLTGPPHPSP